GGLREWEGHGPAPTPPRHNIQTKNVIPLSRPLSFNHRRRGIACRHRSSDLAPVKAILCQRFGAPDDLVLADIPDPVAAPGEVVAKVAAVGLNFFDTLIIAGKYQTKPPFPFSRGGEFGGVVESVGAGVTAFKPGDRVMGYTNFNAARERTAVTADQIVKLPADLDFDRAAALTITYGTAYYALKYRALMRPRETLTVLGASGGA